MTGLDSIEIVGELGEGGMGFALLGKHRTRQVPVAIKGIRDPESSKLRRFFLREARSLAVLEHPGIIELLDYGQVHRPGQALAEGSLYLVMEYADGGELTSSDIGGWSDVQELLFQVLDALAHAHSRHRVHLDLKPENILYTATDAGRRYRIADFGIARITTEFEQPHPSAGTPIYMAPEQARGKWRTLGPWSDLYALGCMTWELTTGEPPFGGATPMAVILEHLDGELPVFAPRYATPPGFERWLRRLLARDPSRRFRDCASAAYVLSELSADFAPADEGVSGGSSDSPDTELLDTQAVTVAMTTLDNNGWATTVVAGDAQPDSTPVQQGAAPQTTDDLRPPYPTQYRRTERTGPDEIEDLGLGLFDLRPIPFVGRHQVLNRMWSAMGEVVGRCAPRAVSVEGRAGVGKTRLVEEFATCQVEQGQARVLYFDFEQRHWSDAVREGVARFFNVVGADDDEIVELVDLHLAGVDADKRALCVEFLTVSDSGDQRKPLLKEICGLLAAIAASMPLIVICDGIGLYPFPLELSESFGAGFPDSPVFFALVVDKQRMTPLVEARLERLDPWERHTLTELTPGQVRRSLHRMFPLTDDELHRLSEHVGSDLNFGRQILAHWLDREKLKHRPDGYCGPERLPATVVEVWLARLRSTFGPSEFKAARQALAVAATLGSVVQRDRWKAVCQSLDIDVSEQMVAMASRRGFLVDDGQYLRFHEASFRRAVLDDLRHRGEAQRLEVACGEVLAESEDLTSRLRAVGCMERAGEFARAVQILSSLAWLSPLRDSESLGSWLDRLIAQADDVNPSEQMGVLRAQAHDHLHNCEFGPADRLLERAQQLVARNPGVRQLQVDYDHVVATRFLFLNDPLKGLKIARKLPEHRPTDAPVQSKINDHHLLAELNLYALRPDEAQAQLELAAPLVEQTMGANRLWESYQHAAIEVFRGANARAAERLDDLLALFQNKDDLFGVLLCRELLADIAGAEDDVTTASRQLNQAIDDAKRCGYYGEFTLHEKLGRLYARSGQPQQALDHLALVREQVEQRGFNIVLWYYFDAEAEACAALGDQAGVADAFSRAQVCNARPGLRAGAIVATWRRVAQQVAQTNPGIADRIVDEADAIEESPLVTPQQRNGAEPKSGVGR